MNQSSKASVTDWVAVVAGSLGALMATLDISITNSALPQIQGEIGASGTEGTWISTAYLLAEIVMIPLAAWLSRVMGLRKFLLSMAVMFTAFSLACGMSDSLPGMIFGRLGQGFAGGAMIPTAQTIIRMRLPKAQMPIGMSVFGLIIILGPLLGPVLGGWLAENVNWTWCFFINLPVAALLIALLLMGLPKDKGDTSLLAKADWLGIIGLSMALSCLTVVLEEGQRDRWFESTMIVVLTVLMLVGFIMVVISQFTSSKPIIKLSLLRNTRYSSIIFTVFFVGMGLYCVSYLLPQFLSTVAGYNAEQAGFVLLVSGVPAFLMMPFLPRIIGKVDTRLLVSFGLVCFAVSCWIDSSLTADSVGSDFTWSQLIRGLGQVLCMMPLNQASMAAVAPEEAADAAGFYNMARNLGGSVGLALIGVFIDRRNTLHADQIAQTVSQNSVIGNEQLAQSAASFAGKGADAAYAHLQAIGQLTSQIKVQATVMTFNETFWMLAAALLVCVPLTLLLKKPVASR
ncbi:DHA2 family efflux MFS transporter permease subunit [Pseudomonas amygdali]|uniref:EmrB/QacA family drug resistance transporter n=2 Tax=Pseudomonas amygdali pv. lachrymans TaxID=53707 RepID=A0ABR5KSH2_PSEAV|nr:DHA2 family efflux MFS transporter permease subunit [Pseudomonas amygdali]AXH60191.1 MFS transporter [Pseudomonas amygdali pv. lachrymans str. M301315]KPC17590.1 EmrB/QacA family drug resistance transporter [Pseudomonas amygdali pv. lachrymans]RMT06492.1 EmrB/QacA family drug resistance transporter [Pseudomonas amygdali pv. lachrymans]